MSDTFDMFDQYDTEKKKRLPFKKRWLFLGALAVLLLAVVIFLYKIYPKQDRISTENLPSSYIIENEDNFYDFQSRSDCGGYATAYVLRHFGIKADGASLYDQMPQFFGSIALHNIVETLEDNGLKAKICHGSIDTLKAELCKGVPVIVSIRIIIGDEEGKHYATVVGYDETYFYLADSTGSKTNVVDQKTYNRKLTYDELKDLWKTGSYPFVDYNYVVTEK